MADARLERLRSVCLAHEIRADYAAKLRQLEGYDIVFLADDSGSMNTPTEGGVKGTDPFARQSTRWSELQLFANRVVDLAACLDPDGIDLVRRGMDPDARFLDSCHLYPCILLHFYSAS
jgi:hypothetical protein